LKTASLLALFLFGVIAVVFSLPDQPLSPRIHDPSTIIKCKDEYWVFSTGGGVLSFRSKDLVTWQPAGPVFTTPPRWLLDTSGSTPPGLASPSGSASPSGLSPGRVRRASFWAPDVIYLNGRYLLYYVSSRFGSRASIIALASNPTLDPADPAYHWTDLGPVIRTTDADKFNAIDPAPILDTDGRMWMTLGSFWTGIKIVELDPATGLRKSGAALHPLAWARQIEASYIIPHAGHYFLFVNWGLCCRGVQSTYEIRIGRADTITGPYRDKTGKDMLSGGGTLFLGTEGRYIGPGQIGLLTQGASQWISYHFYDGENNGQATLGLRKLLWDKEGWPALGEYPANLPPPSPGPAQ
jgi:arabinan endo-1,5-alpha-L-arabinosidase